MKAFRIQTRSVFVINQKYRKKVKETFTMTHWFLT